MYLGTYSQGVYLHENNMLKLAARLHNASWVCRAGEGYLLSVSELTGQDGETEGELVLFKVRPDGMLTEASRAGTGGLAPCHILYEPDAKKALISNYLSGTVGVFSVKDEILIKEIVLNLFDADEQPGHAHCAVSRRGFQMLYVCDLGLDAVFEIDPYHCQKTRIALPEGSGPRHAVLSADEKTLYVVCECSCEVMALDIATREIRSRHALKDLGYTGFAAAAALRLHPSGRLLAASLRGNDKVVLLRLDASGAVISREDMALNAPIPRDIAFSPDGQSLYVAYQDGGRVDVFALKPDGTLFKQNAFEAPSVVSLCF